MNKDSKISSHVFVIWWTLFVLQVDSLHCSTYQSHISIWQVCKSNLTQQSSALSGCLFKVLHTRDIIIQETLLLLLPASSYSTPSPSPILLILPPPHPPLVLPSSSSSSPPTPRQFLLLSHLQVPHTPDISLPVMWLHTSVAAEEVKRLTNVRWEDSSYLRPHWACPQVCRQVSSALLQTC